MRTQRKIIFMATILLTGGSLSFTAAYGLRLRSESYREKIQQELSNFFQLPCDVGQIRGRTFSSRTFEDVTIFLPDRRDRVFSCRTAIWQEVKQDGELNHRLNLQDGILILGTDRWERNDLSQLLQSGLGHDFEELRLSVVTMNNFEVAFHRGEFSIRCRETSGTIDMSDPTEGIARLFAYELNGCSIDDGVRIYARFSPQNGVEVSELILSLPEVPLATIGIGPTLGGDVTHGRFSGRVQYLKTKSSESPEIWIRGDLMDAELYELTSGIPIGPLEGSFSVNVYGARVYDSVVTHFRGRGQITDLSFASFAPLLGLPTLSGQASLDVDLVDIAMGHINRLRLAGDIRDVSLEALLHRWDMGSATGTLRVRVNNLDVADNHIKSADIEITAEPPTDQPGTIDRSLLLAVAEKIFNFSWPSALPQRILPDHLVYDQFGVRLLVRDDQLRILGTHGPDGDTILTIRVFGKSFRLIKEQSGSIDMSPYLDRLFQRMRKYDPDRVRQWWESKTG